MNRFFRAMPQKMRRPGVTRQIQVFTSRCICAIVSGYDETPGSDAGVSDRSLISGSE